MSLVPTPLRRLAAGILFGLVAGLALAVVAPVAVGWRSFTVMSGSMAPTIDTGDAVVVESIAPTSLRPGDVATFNDPEGTGRLITHRVRGIRHVDSWLEVTTKGDANTSTERWRVPVDGRVGRVVYRLPRIGYVLVPSASAIGRLLLVALPTALLGIVGLAGIWRSPSTPTPAPAAAPAPQPRPARRPVPYPVVRVRPGPVVAPARVFATLSPPLHARPRPASAPRSLYARAGQ